MQSRYVYTVFNKVLGAYLAVGWGGYKSTYNFAEARLFNRPGDAKQSPYWKRNKGDVEVRQHLVVG